MSDLEHVIHACVIVAIAYVVMLYGLKQSPSKSETRSLALGSFALSYMLLFGHKLPKF
tara:strand:- start:429 stop:602 length:174 start_codon:yes stop_codon:yes gene_type:complete